MEKELITLGKPKNRGNGQGTVFKLPGGKYRAEVTLGYDKDGKRKCKTKSGFNKKKDALDYLEILKQTVPNVNNDIKFTDLYDEWSEKYFEDITKSTADCYRSAYKYYKDIYYFKFADIKTDLLQGCIDSCPYGRRTKENMKALGTLLFKYAMARDIVDRNYASLTKLPREKDKKTKDIFTEDEIKSLWKTYEENDIIAGYILTMIYTGMRYGELSTILIENINIDEQYLIGGIKTETGKNRAIPICNKLLPVMSKLIEEKSEKLLDLYEELFYNMYYATLKKAGIRRLSPHTCRHTCATALSAEGVPPVIIQQILGHADFATTANSYTHFNIAELLKAVNKIK